MKMSGRQSLGSLNGRRWCKRRSLMNICASISYKMGLGNMRKNKSRRNCTMVRGMKNVVRLRCYETGGGFPVQEGRFL